MKILAVTKKKPTQFAEDIGEKASVVRQWTMGKEPREVPPEYQKRIMAFYGAEWDDAGVRQAGSDRRRPFTRKSFEDWRERLISLHQKRLGFPLPFLDKGKPVLKKNGERYDQYNVESFLIALAFDALGRTLMAAEDRRGKNNFRRLFAVIESFLHWQQGIVEDFNDFKPSGYKQIQDAYLQTEVKNGIPETTEWEKYIRLLKSVADKPLDRYWRFKRDKNGGKFEIVKADLALNYAENSIIEKGSPRHNAHLELLKAMVKRGVKPDAGKQEKIDAESAAANLNAHIEEWKALAKKGDKAAIANLDQYKIEV